MKAYDLNELGKELKDKGLIVAEEVAEQVVVSVFDFLEKSALASENKIDDMLVLAVSPTLKKYLIEDLVDKIDGVDNLPSA